MAEITVDSYPREYDRPPVYDRVPSIEAIARVQGGMTQQDAMANDFSPALRAARIGG